MIDRKLRAVIIEKSMEIRALKDVLSSCSPVAQEQKLRLSEVIKSKNEERERLKELGRLTFSSGVLGGA